MSRVAVGTLAVLALGALVSCGDDAGGIRETERAAPSGMLADEGVLEQMRSTDSGGRVIYAAPPDLSLTSAQQRRPDIFRAPGARATPARPAPRDTTTTEGAMPRTRNP